MSQPDPNTHAANDPTEAEKQWWYNLKTLKVEKGLKSAALYRVGPFATKAEAELAPLLLRERSKAWEREDSEDD